jgi:hypothetical protein
MNIQEFLTFFKRGNPISSFPEHFGIPDYLEIARKAVEAANLIKLDKQPPFELILEKNRVLSELRDCLRYLSRDEVELACPDILELIACYFDDAAQIAYSLANALRALTKSLSLSEQSVTELPITP